MENGFKVFWTDHALKELSSTLSYLEDNFSDKEIKRLAKEIERIITLISQNPQLFPLSENLALRRAIVLGYNSMYYQVEKNEIIIISFFSNRQGPQRLKT